MASAALLRLKSLRGCEMHASVILNQTDTAVLKKLGVNLTSDPVYQTKKLFHR